MTSLKAIRELEVQIECIYQHLDSLWDDRTKAIREFLDEHTNLIRVYIKYDSYYLITPEATTHIVDYTYNLLSKEREFSYEDAKKLVSNITHDYKLGEIMLKGELVSKHLMLRVLDYLKKEYPDCVLDMTFMVDNDEV